MSVVLLQFTPQFNTPDASGCFWTDFVGCTEDCGSPPVTQSAYMDCDTQDSSVGSFTVYPAADADPFAAGTVTVVSAWSWRADPSTNFAACAWKTYCTNANGQTVDDVVPDNASPVAHTFKDEPFFSSTGTLYSADVGLTTIPVEGNSFGMTYDELLTAIGYDNSSGNYGGGTIVMVLVDSVGKNYIATGIYSTCF